MRQIPAAHHRALQVERRGQIPRRQRKDPGRHIMNREPPCGPYPIAELRLPLLSDVSSN